MKSRLMCGCTIAVGCHAHVDATHYKRELGTAVQLLRRLHHMLTHEAHRGQNMDDLLAETYAFMEHV